MKGIKFFPYVFFAILGISVFAILLLQDQFDNGQAAKQTFLTGNSTNIVYIQIPLKANTVNSGTVRIAGLLNNCSNDFNPKCTELANSSVYGTFDAPGVGDYYYGYDRDAATYARMASNNQGYIFVNLSKPIGSENSSVIEVLIGSVPVRVNVSLGTCWDHSSTEYALRFHLQGIAAGSDRFNLHCWDGSWQLMKELEESNGERLWEYSVWWNTSGTMAEQLPIYDKSYTRNLSVEVGEIDGKREYTQGNGIFSNSTVVQISLNGTLINNSLNASLCNCLNCSTSANGRYSEFYCNVPLFLITNNNQPGGVSFYDLNLNYDYTDSFGPIIFNNATNNSNPETGENILFSISGQDDLNLSAFTFAWNCTDNRQFQNITSVVVEGENINSSLTVDLTNTTNIDECSWIMYVNDSVGNWNATPIAKIDLKKNDPVSVANILDKPIELSEDIVCRSTFNDDDGDSWIANETRWFNNSERVLFLSNLTVIGSGNTSNAETWTCSFAVIDSFGRSVFTNDSVLVGDLVNPNISNIKVSDFSILTTGPVDLSAVVVDGSSTVLSDSCKFTLVKSNQNLGAGIGNPFNFSSNNISGSVVSRTFSGGTFSQGTLELTKAYCSDSSGNTEQNITVRLNVTINEPTVITVGGGGGGAAVITECAVDEDCSLFGLGFSCISGKCLKLSRDDVAFANLLARGLSQDIIDSLLARSGGACNFDGICELAEGENVGNCGAEFFAEGVERIAVEGDCTGIEIADIPGGAVTIGAAIIIIGIAVLLYFRRGKR